MLNVIVIILCLAIFVRLFTYQRDGARFSRWKSGMAATVMVCCGSAVIHIATGDLVVGMESWPLVALLGFLAAATMRCGGNIAAVLRGPDEWDGRRDGALHCSGAAGTLDTPRPPRGRR
jgi:hypothetical protein